MGGHGASSWVGSLTHGNQAGQTPIIRQPSFVLLPSTPVWEVHGSFCGQSQDQTLSLSLPNKNFTPQLSSKEMKVASVDTESAGS